MQSHAISCRGKRIRGKAVVIDFISSLWGKAKEEANEERLPSWRRTVRFRAPGISTAVQLGLTVTRQACGRNHRTRRIREMNIVSWILIASTLYWNSCVALKMKLSQGTGERPFTSTQANRWTRLESRDEWIAPQVETVNAPQLAKLPNSYSAKASKHRKTWGNITIFSFSLLLCCLFLPLITSDNKRRLLHYMVNKDTTLRCLTTAHTWHKISKKNRGELQDAWESRKHGLFKINWQHIFNQTTPPSQLGCVCWLEWRDY